MPNSPTSSFIPKQGPAKHSRQLSRQVHIFTIISYVLFFSVLMASLLVFFYDRHIKNQLEAEVVALDAAIANFNNDKMEQIKAFNERLIQTENRIQNSVSAVSVFDSLESSTAAAVGLDTLQLKRIADQTFLVTATVNTSSFDSALFQRGLYERNPIIETVAFQDLGIGKLNQAEGETPSGVSFKALLEVPLSSVPYSVSAANEQVVDFTVPAESLLVSTTTSSSSDIISNQNQI